MDKSEALRSIHFDQIEYIQQKIHVDYDNEQQTPESFHFAGQRYPVCKVFARLRISTDYQGYGYLVEIVDQGVFYLYFQSEDTLYRGSFVRGNWVLCFRILDDLELMQWFVEERKMLMNISLKRVMDFHGHVCPELAVGGKFCEFVQRLFNHRTIPTTGFTIISENATSALDAIQVLLGATIGNQRLMVMDFGKHTYTLYCRSNNKGWKLKQKPISYGDENIFSDLEHKISTDKANLEDLVQYQQLIDNRVKQIMALMPEELFTIEEVDGKAQPQEVTSAYLTCAVCGELVLASRSIESRNMTLCMPCFREMSPGCIRYGIQ